MDAGSGFAKSFDADGRERFGDTREYGTINGEIRAFALGCAQFGDGVARDADQKARGCDAAESHPGPSNRRANEHRARRTRARHRCACSPESGCFLQRAGLLAPNRSTRALKDPWRESESSPHHPARRAGHVQRIGDAVALHKMRRPALGNSTTHSFTFRYFSNEARRRHVRRRCRRQIPAASVPAFPPREQRGRDLIDAGRPLRGDTES